MEDNHYDNDTDSYYDDDSDTIIMDLSDICNKSDDSKEKMINIFYNLRYVKYLYF